jgi:NAD(P)-dependent dehydrogenase (short-subunit alcohol dehydrogenase family)
MHLPLLNMDRVKDKVALISGAGGGVGRACMQLFSAEGATVVGVGRTRASLEQSIHAVNAAGGRGTIFVADLADPSAAEKAVTDTIAAYGRVDIFVHAAGVGYSWSEQSPDSMNDVARTTAEKWREVMGINLDSYFYMCRAVVPQMRRQAGGAIVGVASISGMFGLADGHAYTAAKAGMMNLTRSLCAAYAGDNIRANCIVPGAIATPMIASILGLFDDPVTADRITPARRPGTPEEMAYGCLYLASDEASYCNGTMLIIDGGMSARQ